MALAVHVLKEQIEKAKRNLKSVDENIKKITGRDPNERRPISEGQRLSTGSGRGRQRDTILGRRGRGQLGNFASAEPPSKRTADGDVFSRLATNSGRRVVISRFGAGRQKDDEEDEVDEDEVESSKPAVQSSIVSTAKTITKKDLISAQNVGEKGKARNRRMFGVLLGTLARFQSDSNGPGQQMKQVQRQQEIERRLEEQTTEERKKAASQRRTLFNERKAQQKRIELLEQKIALADEVTEWEKEWALKSNFIMTKASPPIFFHPTDHTARTQKALKESKQRIEGIIEKHRECVEQTMKSIDAEIESLEKKSSEDGKRDGVKVCDKGINGSKNSSSKNNRSHDPEEEMDLDSMGPSVDIKVELDDESHLNQENLDEDYSDNGVAMKRGGFDDVIIKEEPDSQVQTNQDDLPETDTAMGDEDSDRENAVGNLDFGRNVVNNSDLHEDGAGKHSDELCNNEDDSVADEQSEKFDNANTEAQEPSIKDTDLEKSYKTTLKKNEIITADRNAHTKNPESSDVDENDSDEDRNRDKESHSDSKSGGDTSSNERSSSGEEESDKDEHRETNNVSKVESSVAQKASDTSTTEQEADEPQEIANKSEMDMSKKKNIRVEQQSQKITSGLYESKRRQGNSESSDSSSSSEDGSSDSSSSKKKKQKQRTEQRDSSEHTITPQQKSHKGRRHSRSRSHSRDERTSSQSRDRRYNDGQKNRKRR